MQLRNLIQLTASVGAIGLLDRAVAVGLGIIFARWLGPTEFGAYAFVVTAIALLCIPAKLGIPELLTRDIARQKLGNAKLCRDTQQRDRGDDKSIGAELSRTEPSGEYDAETNCHGPVKQADRSNACR